MATLKRILIFTLTLVAMTSQAWAQDNSSNSGVSRRDGNSGRNTTKSDGASQRLNSRYDGNGSITDADVQWMRVIYRQLDLLKSSNAALYFPEDPIDGQENLFRIIMRLLNNGTVQAYEYLDGREIFTDEYKVDMKDVYERFHIPYTTAKGSTEKKPLYHVEPIDVPTNEVLTYYIIERWEYDTRTNKMRSNIEAICPVLHRAGDFGGDAVRYPMFWVKFADLRSNLALQPIFVSDENNLPTCTYDDFFTLNMYDGEIYKTRNLRNQSLMQMHPDPDDLKHAQDSIQAHLDSFEKKLWVPDREEIIAAREAKEKAEEEAAPDLSDVVVSPEGVDGDAENAAPAKDESETKSVRKTSRSSKSKSKKSSQPKKEDKEKKEKKSKVQKPKSSSSSSSNNAVRSVRRKK